MFLRCFLYLLYMLQLVVLSGLVAAFLYGGSNQQPPTSLAVQTTPPPPPAEENSPKDEQLKVRMKQGLKSHLQEEYNRLPLAHDPIRQDSVRHYPVRQDSVRHGPVRHGAARRVTILDVDRNLYFRPHSLSRSVRSAKKSQDIQGHNKKKGSISRADQHDDDDADNHDMKEVDENLISLDDSQTDELLNDNKEKDKTVTDALDNDVVDVKGEDFEDEYYTDDQNDEATDEQFEVFEAALHHMEEIGACPALRCHHPTPFVLQVRDSHDGSRMYLPECVILHRCMNYSGCCGGGNHECVPKKMNILSKAFLVLDRRLGEANNNAFHPKMATTISFVNHTECECREKPKLPKCTKTCPAPFRLSRDGADCVCDCFPLAGLDPWTCRVIKDGVVPLSDDSLMCVKNDNCYIPRCTAGELDVNTGSCPLSDDYALPGFLFDDHNQRRFYRAHLHGYDFSRGNIITSSLAPGVSSSSLLSKTSTHLKGSHHGTEKLSSQSNTGESTTFRVPAEILHNLALGNLVPVNSTQVLRNESEENKYLLSESDNKIPEIKENNSTTLKNKSDSIKNKSDSADDKHDSSWDKHDSSEDKHDSLESKQDSLTNTPEVSYPDVTKSEHEPDNPRFSDEPKIFDDDFHDGNKDDYSEEVSSPYRES